MKTLTYANTYWCHKGKHQALLAKLYDLVRNISPSL